MTENEANERLRHASWRALARPFFSCLEGEGGITRAVGGIVRDTVLGIERSTTDIDLATTLFPEEVMQRAKAVGLAVHPTGVEHGTVTLVAGGVTAEVTTLREDVETFGRRAKVRFGSNWRRDAERRDFTMNALYCDADGTLFDPLGGLADCLARRVRFIGDPDERIAEDRLRVYRYFRFAASHGLEVFDAEALDACARAAGTLNLVSAERVGAEMTRLLSLPKVALTLKEMRATDVLEPELLSDSVLRALQRYEEIEATPSLPVRLALIAGNGDELALLKQRWRLSNALSIATATIIEGLDLAAKAEWPTLAYRFKSTKLDILAASWSLADNAPADFTAKRSQLEKISPPEFPLRGRDLSDAGLSGRDVGDMLRSLETRWIESGFTLDKDELLGLF